MKAKDAARAAELVQLRADIEAARRRLRGRHVEPPGLVMQANPAGPDTLVFPHILVPGHMTMDFLNYVDSSAREQLIRLGVDPEDGT